MRRARVLLRGWTIGVLVFLYAPIAVLIVFSFNASRLNIVWTGFTLDWYAALWHDTELVRALDNSLVVAAVTTIVSVVLGTGAAWLLVRHRFPAGGLTRALAYTPIIVPEIIMGISLLIFFVSVRLELGYTTIIISHVTFCFPFVMAAVEARLAGLDPALEEAALDLGATPAVAFRRVLVPFLAPGIASGALMAFTLSLDELIVTYFTASAATRTLPLEIFGRIKRGLDPTLNAISALFIVATVLLVAAAELLRRRGRGR